MVNVEIINNQSSLDVCIHFCFEDITAHFMDAQIFNNCQREFICALKEINKYINEPLIVEITSRSEGSVIDTLKIIAKHPAVIAVIASFTMAFFTVQFRPNISEIEEAKIKQEIIKIELDNTLGIKEAITSGKLTEADYDFIARNDKNLQKKKSHFFIWAKKETRLTQIEINTDTKIDNKEVFDKISIPYKNFDDFIMMDADERDKTVLFKDLKARIFIVSPVLVKGVTGEWRGYYNGSSIKFIITDKDFLEQIYEGDVKFGNGTYIECTLITVLNETKEAKSRDVVKVDNYGDDMNFVKPIKHRNINSEDNKQGSLFDEGLTK